MTTSITEILPHFMLWGIILLPMMLLGGMCISVLQTPSRIPSRSPQKNKDDEDDDNNDGGWDNGKPPLPDLPPDWHSYARGADDFSLLKDIKTTA